MTYSRLAEPPACQSPGSSRTARPRANEYSGTLLRAGVPSVSIDEPEVPGDLRQAPGHQVVHSVRYVARPRNQRRSEEHTSELQSHVNLVCRLLLEKKKKKK